MAKFVWLGQKLGLVAKPKPEDEETTDANQAQKAMASKPPAPSGPGIEQRPMPAPYSQATAATLFTTGGKQPASYPGATGHPGSATGGSMKSGAAMAPSTSVPLKHR